FALVGLGLEHYYTWDRPYYTVLNRDVVDGLQWLAHDRREGDLAASAAAWPSRPLGRWAIGWWVEGLGRVPTYVETDQRWIFFAQEADQAQTAGEIFAQPDPRLAAAEALRHGITLLVIDKRDNSRVDQWLTSGRLGGALQ